MAEHSRYVYHASIRLLTFSPYPMINRLSVLQYNVRCKYLFISYLLLLGFANLCNSFVITQVIFLAPDKYYWHTLAIL